MSSAVSIPKDAIAIRSDDASVDEVLKECAALNEAFPAKVPGKILKSNVAKTVLELYVRLVEANMKVSNLGTALADADNEAKQANLKAVALGNQLTAFKLGEGSTSYQLSPSNITGEIGKTLPASLSSSSSSFSSSSSSPSSASEPSGMESSSVVLKVSPPSASRPPLCRSVWRGEDCNVRDCARFHKQQCKDDACYPKRVSNCHGWHHIGRRKVASRQQGNASRPGSTATNPKQGDASAGSAGSSSAAKRKNPRLGDFLVALEKREKRFEKTVVRVLKKVGSTVGASPPPSAPSNTPSSPLYATVAANTGLASVGDVAAVRQPMSGERMMAKMQQMMQQQLLQTQRAMEKQFAELLQQ